MCSNRRFRRVISKHILSFDPAQTIKKLLDCTERRPMQFLGVIKQVEMHAKLVVQ